MISFKEIVILHTQPNKTGSIVQKYIFNYFSIPLTYLIVNYTKLTPNRITLIGFLFYLISLYFLYTQEFLYGFIFYWISFIFDIVDGNVARLKKLSSLSGAYLDIILDWIKPSFAYLIIFFYTQNSLLLYLIIINFLAAGSWRIYLNLLPSGSSNSQISINIKNNRFKNIILLSSFSAIEVEFLVVGLYLINFNEIFLYLALIIRVKDMLKNTLSSYIKLKKIDSSKND